MRSEPRNARIPVWALPVSLAATPGIDLSFSSSGYLDVSVHRVPPVYLWIQYTVTEVSSAGFPHSDICGSLDICSLPQLFAAYHVFLRLLVPRHPPCALSSLTSLRKRDISIRWTGSLLTCPSKWNMSHLRSKCSWAKLRLANDGFSTLPPSMYSVTCWGLWFVLIYLYI